MIENLERKRLSVDLEEPWSRQEALSEILRQMMRSGQRPDLGDTPVMYGFFEDELPMAVPSRRAHSEVLDPLTTDQAIHLVNKLSMDMARLHTKSPSTKGKKIMNDVISVVAGAALVMAATVDPGWAGLIVACVIARIITEYNPR